MKAPCTRLDQCRNQDNNPDSLAYKRKLEELVDDDLLLEDHTPSKQEARMDWTGKNACSLNSERLAVKCVLFANSNLMFDIT
jgi:hypothetical protein